MGGWKPISDKSQDGILLRCGRKEIVSPLKWMEIIDWIEAFVWFVWPSGFHKSFNGIANRTVTQHIALLSLGHNAYALWINIKWIHMNNIHFIWVLNSTRATIRVRAVIVLNLLINKPCWTNTRVYVWWQLARNIRAHNIGLIFLLYILNKMASIWSHLASTQPEGEGREW